MKNNLYVPVVFLLMMSVISARTLSVRLIQPLTIDGWIRPAEWQNAVMDSCFVQIEPDKGKPASQKTYVLVAMDAFNLYVGFVCLNSDIGELSAGNRQRDLGSLTGEDGVMLLLDTFQDGRSAYLFHVNLLNTQTDLRIEHNGSSIDNNWDAEWLSAVRKDTNGWYAEIAIPFKSIKYSSSIISWGVNFGRSLARSNEIAWWSGALEDNYRISEAGEMVFEQKPKERRPSVWIPYTSLYQENDEAWQMVLGLDGEIPVTSDLAGNITINPDFASVEGDQEEINIDPWEIEYPEKRPFFRDVNALFDVRYNVFYSRRIGDIFHGEKLYGKIGGVQVAGVYARTHALINQETNAIELPRANFSVLRFQKDILSSSTVGITAVEKRWSDGTNRAFSLDTDMRLPFQIYASGQLFFTTPGKDVLEHSGGFIRIARETNEYHYHLRLTSLGSALKDNVNSTGYLSYDDVIELDCAVEYSCWPKAGSLKKIGYESDYKIDWTQDRNLGRYEIKQSLETYFSNRVSVGGDFVYDYRGANWRKDGQSHSTKRVFDLALGYNTLEWSHAEISYEFGQTFDGIFGGLGVSARFKPLKQISLAYEMESRRYDHTRSDPIAQDVNVHILSSDIYFTPDLFIRVFTQYRSDSDRYYLYGLIGYRYRPPDSAVYLNYSYDRIENELEPLDTSDQRLVFMKISHAFHWL
ncbi:MAG: carbohydrate binding family 9 domain-containing protein [Candidatus Marinimicrobia bacterium]|nr:carbohydrate binding family 9 domain-containing protein [Candidatus Neomarinimicrobiota bacterium]